MERQRQRFMVHVHEAGWCQVGVSGTIRRSVHQNNEHDAAGGARRRTREPRREADVAEIPAKTKWPTEADAQSRGLEALFAAAPENAGNVFPPTTAREKVLHACVRALANVYKELDNWDPAESPPRLAAQARQHLITYIELRDTADEEFNILWRVLPKHHLFIHIAEATQSTRLCPKLEWCYGDEDEIGRCVKSAKKGNAMHLSTSLLAHYRASFEQ